MFKLFSFVSLIFEPASDWRKTNKGWSCAEKDVEAKVSIKVY